MGGYGVFTCSRLVSARKTSQKKPHIPIVVLTNGTMFFDKNVREAIIDANVILPSLDAATENVFTKINRPHCDLKIGKYIQ